MTGSGKRTALLGVLVAALLLLGFWHIGQSRSGEAQRDFENCVSNIKRIALAADLYSNSPGVYGRYPTSLKQLTPHLLSTVPTCPSARQDTYSASYRSQSNPDVFTLYCRGNNHPLVASPNEPRYEPVPSSPER